MSPQRKCPVCEKPIQQASAIFCSHRCQQVDFFRWWDGQYAIVEDLDPVELHVRQMEQLEADNQ